MTDIKNLDDAANKPKPAVTWEEARDAVKAKHPDAEWIGRSQGWDVAIYSPGERCHLSDWVRITIDAQDAIEPAWLSAYSRMGEEEEVAGVECAAPVAPAVGEQTCKCGVALREVSTRKGDKYWVDVAGGRACHVLPDGQHEEHDPVVAPHRTERAEGVREAARKIDAHYRKHFLGELDQRFTGPDSVHVDVIVEEILAPLFKSNSLAAENAELRRKHDAGRA